MANNRRFRGPLKWLGTTVIDDIWPEIFFFTAVATMVVLVTKKTDVDLSISNQMFAVLGIVLGLVVSFRTSSAYERYAEGRKLWTSIHLASHNLAHLIWIQLPNERVVDPAQAQAEHDLRQYRLMTIIEKKTMINLVQSFSVAVKHMLRGEPGIYYEDLYHLVCFLPVFASEHKHGDDAVVLPVWDHSLRAVLTNVPNVPIKRTQSDPGVTAGSDGTLNGDAEKDGHLYRLREWFAGSREKSDQTIDLESVLPSKGLLLPAENPPKATMYDYLPILLLIKPVFAIIKFCSKRLQRAVSASAKANKPNERFGDIAATDTRTVLGKKKRPAIVSTVVPLEITLFLSSYLSWLQRHGYDQPSLAAGQISDSIRSLQEAVANLHRIRSTPLPFAYQAHLRMSMWLYLFFLPFQVVADYGYIVIPATALASFLLLGFLEIGQEIEDPFGYDYNDLPLDEFCLSIQRDLHEITAHPAPEPPTFIFGRLNQPFMPADPRNAKELLETNHEYYDPDLGDASIRRMMLRNWKKLSG